MEATTSARGVDTGSYDNREIPLGITLAQNRIISYLKIKYTVVLLLYGGLTQQACCLVIRCWI